MSARDAFGNFPYELRNPYMCLIFSDLRSNPPMILQCVEGLLQLVGKAIHTKLST